MTRTIGLIGGMSWESSAEYYRLLNEEVRRRLGGHHCARSLMLTVDFAEVEAMQRAGDWAAAGRLLAGAAGTLEAGGAEMVLLCTNTMHRVAEEIEAVLTVPFVHLVDATAERITAAGVTTAGLLGTRFTMEMDFYRDRMRRHGIEVVVPDEPGRTLVHDVIYRELTRNRIEESSRQAYRRVIADLAARGAEGVILGCTEITLLVGPQDSPVPVFDSTRIHVERAVDLALAGTAELSGSGR
ncbi:aspartate/glutamate racemase family protein [Planomonospora venezuelensis]|uniref:Aspartate racemase n=1 Tax=Planomonospora venezuelensis TaxID=1999 RepID=A0A841D3Z7_PLAVE|nr:aspartate/glutamate racemase family protein [Planomonospora venezuelensis]MBB5965382.1 aspartate racemase [Planomonospora venezuelensis]GIN05151.1 aspartate racemase [Planomonospora venezuelensis]